MKKALLRCSIKGCPRTRWINFDKACFPKTTTMVTLKCPWHDDNDFDTEQYFDKDGNELYWKPKDL